MITPRVCMGDRVGKLHPGLNGRPDRGLAPGEYQCRLDASILVTLVMFGALLRHRRRGSVRGIALGEAPSVDVANVRRRIDASNDEGTVRVRSCPGGATKTHYESVMSSR